MMAKRPMFCTEKNMEVEALVQEKKSGRGSAATVSYAPLTCQNAKNCERTTFCRFVNPLTTRIPLTMPQASNITA